MLESVDPQVCGAKILNKAMNYNNMKEEKSLVCDLMELDEGPMRHHAGWVNCLLLV